MQQGGGSQYGVSPEMAAPFASATTTTTTTTRTHVLGGADHHHQLNLGDPALAVAEEASPISSRPPAHSSAGNFDELLPVGGGLPDEDTLAAGDDADRGGVAGGNRWPRQETLALLKIRSDMDVAFRDATLKGPLWEDVSRKLAELGYTRSAKKCKEKFENVHKYYKRTKEGRAGRQDGKSYRFFTQLEALHNTATATSNVSAAPATPLTAVTATTPTSATTPSNTNTVSPATNLLVAPISIGIGTTTSNPIPVSSVRISNPSLNPSTMGASNMFPPDLSSGMITAPTGSAAAPAPAPTTHAALGISFSSNTSSSSSGGSDDDDEQEDEDLLQGDPSNADSSRYLRKRKRGSSGGGSSNSRRMMDFFESLMKQVMEKQEVMQQRFLETIEKREQDRMIREEAWKRQEMARLSREHDIMAQDRALSASRDAAIIAFLQKITGQTIHLPQPVTIPAVPPPSAPAPVPPPAPAPPQPQQHHLHQPQPQQQHHHHHHHPQHHHQQQQTHHLHHQHQSQSTQVVRHQPSSISSEIVMAIPEQQVPPQELSSGGGSLEPSSSRWPKAEVLALIQMRSGLDSRYQEAGPKGPLWEEISAGMLQMGYKRSSKRCKEKWENINKYFKKVKESNKKRPEDAKTCPYFHQLDALYRQKQLGGSTSGSGTSASGSYVNPNRPGEHHHQQQPPPPQNESTKLDSVPAIMPPPITTSQATESENKNGSSSDEQTNNGGLPGSLFGEGSSTPGGGGGGAKKPEDIVKDQQGRQQVVMEDYDNVEELDSDNLDQEDEEDDDDDVDDDDEGEESEEERKMGYKIEFQRQQNAGSSNGGGNGTPSFLAVVQ